MFPTTDRLYKTRQESQETYKSWSNPQRIDRRTEDKVQLATATNEVVAEQLLVAGPTLGRSFSSSSLHSLLSRSHSPSLFHYFFVFFLNDHWTTALLRRQPCDPPTQHSLTLFYSRGNKRFKKVHSHAKVHSQDQYTQATRSQNAYHYQVGVKWS